MKIYRDFVSTKPGEGTCRVELELTKHEMMDAFYAKEHEWDMDYIIELAELNADEEWPGTMERLEVLRSDQELCSKVARCYRKYINDWIVGEVEQECFREAWDFCTKEENLKGGVE